jgi:hypothetical protein
MISTEEVHKIAILDIRLLNADRNAANLLCRRRRNDTFELIPIDHGFCLRSKCDVSWMDWCWLDWPQLKEPLSDKHKKYVSSLDVEHDARLLRERLSISEEAIDCLRASTAILKAGVKAGLTLYDIATLCCRNDSLGEVPSKLEVLMSMASELATVAVENERWHHSAASRALVEQLSPKPPARGGRALAALFRRSQSSGEFLMSRVNALDVEEKDLSDDCDFFNVVHGASQSPSMAQSSESDSSSGLPADEEIKEDCEEWAANVIASVRDSVNPRDIGFRRSCRSGSDASDDFSVESGSSQSPKGFWLTRPSDSPAAFSDASVQWENSPKITPRSIVSVADARPMSPLELDKMPNPNAIKPSVKFAVDLKTGLNGLIPPKTVNVVEYKAGRDGPTFPRSKSYSALSRATSAFSSEETSDLDIVASMSSSKANAHHRTYFLKFIDLVVVREMSVAVQTKAS